MCELLTEARQAVAEAREERGAGEGENVVDVTAVSMVFFVLLVLLFLLFVLLCFFLSGRCSFFADAAWPASTSAFPVPHQASTPICPHPLPSSSCSFPLFNRLVHCVGRLSQNPILAALQVEFRCFLPAYKALVNELFTMDATPWPSW